MAFSKPHLYSRLVAYSELCDFSSLWFQVLVHELFLISNVCRYLRQNRCILQSGKHEHSHQEVFGGFRDFIHFFLSAQVHHVLYKECLLPTVNSAVSVVYLSSVSHATSYLQNDTLQSSQVNVNDYLFSRFFINLKAGSVQKPRWTTRKKFPKNLKYFVSIFSRLIIAGFNFDRREN